MYSSNTVHHIYCSFTGKPIKQYMSQERSVKKLALSMSVLILLALVGVAFYASSEDWTATQAFYWTVCTMTVRRWLCVFDIFYSALNCVLSILLFCYHVVCIDGWLWRLARAQRKHQVRMLSLYQCKNMICFGIICSALYNALFPPLLVYVRRLFSIFFIASCVIVYATTMYNIREYYRLSAQLAIPHDSDDRAHNASHKSTHSTDGDIELNPLRGGSFDSTEDTSLSSSPEKLPYTMRISNTTTMGYRRVGLDPLDTELDVSRRSAQHTEESISTTQDSPNYYSVAGSQMVHSKIFPTRLSTNVNLKTGVDLQATKDGSGGSAAARGNEKDRVDATLYLLQLLVNINGEGGALSHDLMQLRKVSLCQ